MYISRSAKEGQSDILLVLAGLANTLHNGIHGQSDLYVKGTIEVGISTDYQRLITLNGAQPVANFGGLSEEITTSSGKQLVVVLDVFLENVISEPGGALTCGLVRGKIMVPQESLARPIRRCQI